MNPKDLRFIEQLSEALAPIFKANGWEWANGIPSAKDIADMFASLYQDILRDENCNYVSSGRLCVAARWDGGNRQFVFGIDGWRDEEG